MLDVDFGSNPGKMRSNYLDMYDGVHTDVVCANRFDESPDLSITYLGKKKMARETKVKAEGRFPISGQGCTLGKLLDNTDCQIQLDTGASKSYMSKSFYLRCNTLHALPKFASNTQRIQVRNGQYVGVTMCPILGLPLEVVDVWLLLLEVLVSCVVLPTWLVPFSSWLSLIFLFFTLFMAHLVWDT